MKTWMIEENKEERRCWEIVNRLRRWYGIAMLVTIGLAIFFLLRVWSLSVEGQAHFQPDYPQVNLETILAREEISQLTPSDYETLLYQTGLGRDAVDQLWEDGEKQQLLRYQQDFFRPIRFRCTPYNLLVSGEYVVNEDGIKTNGTRLVNLREGDILITPCSHFFGWRNGHAAIFVDQQEGKTLESITVGVNSKLRDVQRWARYPAFAILRLREEEDTQNNAVPVGKVAAILAKNCFNDIPYRLTDGLWGKPWEVTLPAGTLPAGTLSAGNLPMGALMTRDAVDFSGEAEVSVEEVSVEEVPVEEKIQQWARTQKAPEGTQCASLIWSVYRALGYDLDSDGGRLVTPSDLAASPLLEVVQIYGINPEFFH